MAELQEEIKPAADDGQATAPERPDVSPAPAIPPIATSIPPMDAVADVPVDNDWLNELDAGAMPNDVPPLAAAQPKKRRFALFGSGKSKAPKEPAQPSALEQPPGKGKLNRKRIAVVAASLCGIALLGYLQYGPRGDHALDLLGTTLPTDGLPEPTGLPDEPPIDPRLGGADALVLADVTPPEQPATHPLPGLPAAAEPFPTQPPAEIPASRSAAATGTDQAQAEERMRRMEDMLLQLAQQMQTMQQMQQANTQLAQQLQAMQQTNTQLSARLAQRAETASAPAAAAVGQEPAAAPAPSPTPAPPPPAAAPRPAPQRLLVHIEPPAKAEPPPTQATASARPTPRKPARAKASAPAPTTQVAAASKPALSGQLVSVDMWNGEPSVVVTSGIPGDRRVRVLRPGDVINGMALKSADPVTRTATFVAPGSPGLTLSVSQGG